MRYLLKVLPSELKQDILGLRTRVSLFLFNLIPDLLSLRVLRHLMLKLGGARVPLARCYIRSPFYSSDLTHLSIGTGVFINRGVRIEGWADVSIGKGCQIGPNVCIENVNHTPDGGDAYLPVSIGNHVWLGAGVIILPGAILADGCRVAAGSVVAKSLNSGGLYGGIPARRIEKA